MNKTIFLIFSALLFGCELKEEKIKNIIKINEIHIICFDDHDRTKSYPSTFHIKDNKIEIFGQSSDVYAESKADITDNVINLSFKGMTKFWEDGRYSIEKYDIDRYSLKYSHEYQLFYPKDDKWMQDEKKFHNGQCEKIEKRI
ncbi:MAG: hypothetical protein EBZ95_13650 [Chitinophagia bacterium]|nr:hypothetical protein [Chitinophagia bacterium]